MRRARQKFDDVPMFEVRPVTSAIPPPAPRSADYGRCPGHAYRPGGKNPGVANNTGLIRDGEHLYWREHYVTTWSGARRLCSAAHQRLCDRPGRGALDPTCPCQAEPEPAGGVHHDR